MDKIYLKRKQCDNPKCRRLARVQVKGGAKYCLKHYQIRTLDLKSLGRKEWDIE